MNPKEAKSVLEMARGAIAERADYEMTRIIQNIMDVNTRPDRKRTLTLILEITPDAERKNLRLMCTAKSKLEPTNPVSTSLYITNDENGDFAVVELMPAEQLDLFSAEQELPALLRLA